MLDATSHDARPLPDQDASVDAAARGDAGSPPDAGADTQPEAGADLDASRTDAAAEPNPPDGCAPFALPADCVVPSDGALPSELRCTGLYADMNTRTLACGLVEYTPAYELWSDGARKRRWASIPEGTRVDTSNPDGFVYPVGTQFWKEFQVRVGGSLRTAETRLLRKVAGGWTFTTYVWSEDQQAAAQRNDGVADWAGSGHTIPTRDQCLDCHAGRADRILGWDPILLGPGAHGVSVDMLAAGDPNDDDAGTAPYAVEPPGDAVERAALGYLHVNCGVSCHNASAEARARDTGLVLALRAASLGGVLQTPAAATAINASPSGNAPLFELPPPPEGSFYELLPGSPDRSLVLARMALRGHPAQMPPIASNRVDDAGVAAISAWIEHMTPERGYPRPAP